MKLNRTIYYLSLHDFQKFNQQKFPFRAITLSSRPFRNDLIARCSEAYVMKDVNIIPPTTIKPNLFRNINQFVSLNLERKILEKCSQQAHTHTHTSNTAQNYGRGIWLDPLQVECELNKIMLVGSIQFQKYHTDTII